MTFYRAQAAKAPVPEYEKSLLSWSGQGNRTASPAQVTVKVIKVARSSQKHSAHATSHEATTSPIKRAAPISTSSTSSSLSSLTSMSSGSAADELDARVTKKPKLDNASSPPKSMHPARDASQPPKAAKNASLSPKHVRAVKDASPIVQGSKADKDALFNPASSRRVNVVKDALSRVTSSTSASAESSRTPSPSPIGKSAAAKRSTSTSRASRRAGTSTDKVRRRRKKALCDLTLPPKKGTYQGLAPVMVRSASASRSTTACESDSNLPPPKPRLERVTWTMQDGCVGNQLRSSGEVVNSLTKIGRYITFFKNPNDPNDKSYELSECPTVELEYPNNGAKETFLLARPKDVDHYDPTLDIENTLRTFIKDVVPSEHRDLFGPLPEDVLLSIPDADDADDTKMSLMPIDFSSPLTQRSSCPSSRASASSSLTALSSDSDHVSPPPPTSSLRCSPAPRGLMRTLVRARNREDGPTYRATLKEINRYILELKEHTSGENILRRVPYTWSVDGIPQGVVLRIIEETYQRCVGPQINLLRKYEAFSSNVYGELTPTFVTDIIERTGLRSDSLFLDLGSGVGNVVLQAALQTGCTAFGIEERDDTARLADDQLEQVRLRCRMWGVSFGEVELKQGDMTASPRVDELMSKADVVLVNNYVFSEELNAALRPKFLDLKEGAYVVSLKPFAPPNNQMLTERNFDDLSAIFDVYAYPYHSGTVSWSSGNGMYYIHHVNREGYRKNREAFENLHMRAERRRGSRR